MVRPWMGTDGSLHFSQAGYMPFAGLTFTASVGYAF